MTDARNYNSSGGKIVVGDSVTDASGVEGRGGELGGAKVTVGSSGNMAGCLNRTMPVEKFPSNRFVELVECCCHRGQEDRGFKERGSGETTTMMAVQPN